MKRIIEVDEDDVQRIAKWYRLSGDWVEGASIRLLAALDHPHVCQPEDEGAYDWLQSEHKRLVEAAREVVAAMDSMRLDYTPTITVKRGDLSLKVRERLDALEALLPKPEPRYYVERSEDRMWEVRYSTNGRAGWSIRGKFGQEQDANDYAEYKNAGEA